MKIDLLRHLVCPDCQGALALSVSNEEDGRIRTGMLTCELRGHTFPIQRFVPRFVDSDKYADTFSRQRLYVRRHFKYYAADRSGDELFWKSTGFQSDDLTRGLTLEIGCGYGRFVDVVQRGGGAVVGVDLSTHSIDLAYDFIGRREGVHLVQADLFHLPFRQRYFNRIYSIGVLHHTPDTRRAFQAIAPYVKSGGRISIWVYDPETKQTSNIWRRLTTRFNQRFLYGMCVVNQVATSWVRALPGGWRLMYVIPGAPPGPGRPFWLRVLSDFDSLSPRFAHVHTPEEVRKWFADAGLIDAQTLDRRTAVTGTVPHATQFLNVSGPNVTASLTAAPPSS